MAATAHDIRRGADPSEPRTVLRLNAIVSLVAGSLMLFIAGPLASLLGIGGRGALAIAGLVLLAVGLDEFLVAVGRRMRVIQVRLFALADLVLVGGGVAFLAAGPVALSVVERAFVAVVAVVLGWFAIAAFRSARALR